MHLRSGVQDQQQVFAGIHFGVVRLGLGDTEQTVDLGQQLGQRTAVAEYTDKNFRIGLHQGAADFLPAALGRQCLQFATLSQFPHQSHGFRRNGEPHAMIAGGIAGDAQHAHRVLDERGGHMTQHAVGEVTLAAIGVYHLAVRIHGHGIDGQIAADQILLQGDVRAGVEGKPTIALAALALGASQRILLAGLRVQEDRKVLANRTEAGIQHDFRRGADNHPIVIAEGMAQQLITHSAADQVGFICG